MRFTSKISSLVACLALLVPAASSQQSVDALQAAQIAERSLPGVNRLVVTRPFAIGVGLLEEQGNLVWAVNVVGNASYQYTVRVLAVGGTVVNIVNNGRWNDPMPNILLSRAGQIARAVVPGVITNISLGTVLQSQTWSVVIDSQTLGVFVVSIDANTGVVLGVRRL